MKKPAIIKNLLVITLLALTLAANCQTRSVSPLLSKGSPESVGMSTERLARIDAMCEQAVSQGDIPGVVALVARHGKIVYHKAFGMADSRSNRSLKKDDIFRIASQTKAITATAVLMLWEEGQFRLDDPISKYIPEFNNPQVLETFQNSDTSYTTVAASEEITIRHLITHTSGIGYGMIDQDESFKMIYHKAGIIDAFTTDNISIEENIKQMARLPLHHDPGEDWTYSEGLDVLGYFIEIISGVPFDVFLRERLFDPLEMNDTWFYLPAEIAQRLVPVQEPTDDGEWSRYQTTYYDPDYPINGAKRFYSGGAGLSSTAEDYAAFLQMYLNGGELNGTRILSRTTVRSIMGNQIGDLWGEDSDSYYGLAFAVLTEEGQAKGGNGSVGTFSWGGYFNTSYFADPQEQIIGVLMKQTRGQVSDDTGWMFRLLVGQAVGD